MTESVAVCLPDALRAGSTGRSAQNPADVIKDFSRQRVVRRAGLRLLVMMPMDPDYEVGFQAPSPVLS